MKAFQMLSLATQLAIDVLSSCVVTYFIALGITKLFHIESDIPLVIGIAIGLISGVLLAWRRLKTALHLNASKPVEDEKPHDA